MENEVQIPPLGNIMNLRYIAAGRVNQDFLFFCEQLLKPAVGAIKFNTGLNTNTALSDVA